MKKLLAISILSIFFSTGWSQTRNYLPAPVKNHQILSYTQFTLSYNEAHEQPDWVAYELTGEEATEDLPRCNKFKEDKTVSTGSAVLADYRNTGFDRGHLSPAADNNLSELANCESFLLSNMSPQFADFNRGIWAQLERWVREQAEAYDTVWVVTGPVFQNNFGKIGKNGVTIPGYYFKALVRMDGKKAHSIAFLLPQFNVSKDFKDYLVSVNVVETLTGIDLFPDFFPNSTENKVESRFSVKRWEF